MGWRDKGGVGTQERCSVVKLGHCQWLRLAHWRGVLCIAAGEDSFHASRYARHGKRLSFSLVNFAHARCFPRAPRMTFKKRP